MWLRLEPQSIWLVRCCLFAPKYKNEEFVRFFFSPCRAAAARIRGWKKKIILWINNTILFMYCTNYTGFGRCYCCCRYYSLHKYNKRNLISFAKRKIFFFRTKDKMRFYSKETDVFILLLLLRFVTLRVYECAMRLWMNLDACYSLLDNLFLMSFQPLLSYTFVTHKYFKHLYACITWLHI